MSSVARLAEIGALIGDPTRCAMLVALMDGRALTASELARAAGVTPPTASSHLAQLTQADLLSVIRQGRHRYHQIASAEVARMLEGLMAVASRTAAPQRVVATGPRDQSMRDLRTCYDHLAGRHAVAIADGMAARGQIVLSPDGGRLTEAGEALLRTLSIDVPAEPGLLVRPCLDWSERRFHLGGGLGAALQQAFLTRGWIRRSEGSRAVSLSPDGRRALADLFDLEALRA
ncbi:ArsR/SmtB family transcription factor [Phenylobacterium deserti]|uniref:Transcriptional regulator n=1 Tax=Phenylobacterium deserti TaxID=1914756 RepID=A0A328AGS9_9CAUL|nr:metalloregulator ArsR/SmtB family transcription factor [Phenylobacterium deserti]RAK52048.1 transcriptional regulator [Phenylobacterium deserti]